VRALWLPAVLRAAGLDVHEVSGWKTRGSDSWGPVRGITCHHTAGSRTSTDEGEIRTLLNGSSSAPPPIAQLYLSRTGHWHVVASGTCFHNKLGWGGPNEGYGNDALLGIEAQHSGGDEPWTATQYDSYVRGVAALVKHKAPGWDVTVARVAGHKEHQPGAKTDPSFSMPTFRSRVAAAIEGDDGVSVQDVRAYMQSAAKGVRGGGDATNIQDRKDLVDVIRFALGFNYADQQSPDFGTQLPPARFNQLAAAIAGVGDVDETALAAALAPVLGIQEDAVAAALRRVLREGVDG
jgi:hypothetical protein